MAEGRNSQPGNDDPDTEIADPFSGVEGGELVWDTDRMDRMATRRSTIRQACRRAHVSAITLSLRHIR